MNDLDLGRPYVVSKKTIQAYNYIPEALLMNHTEFGAPRNSNRNIRYPEGKTWFRISCVRILLDTQGFCFAILCLFRFISCRRHFYRISQTLGCAGR